MDSAGQLSLGPSGKGYAWAFEWVASPFRGERRQYAQHESSLDGFNHMKVGFLVGSVSREAGGLFQSVRGLAKAVASANMAASVFGISDEKSAVDSLE